MPNTPMRHTFKPHLCGNHVWQPIPLSKFFMENIETAAYRDGWRLTSQCYNCGKPKYKRVDFQEGS